jgi:hypothetical protein
MEQENNDLRLTLSWQNISNFENVKRLKFLHIFNNQVMKEELILNDDPANESYFTVTDTSQVVSLHSDIPRQENIIGIHSLEVYYSFNLDGETWLSLFENELMIEITGEHISRDFSSEEYGSIELKPVSNVIKGYVTTDAHEYILFNKHTNEELFDHTIRIVKLDNDTFKIYNKDIYNTKWLSLNQTDGSILWLDNSDDAVILRRVSITSDDGVTTNTFMTNSQYVLYKKMFKPPKFGNISEVSSTDYAIVAAKGKNPVAMLSPWGGKNISFTREQVVGMGRRGHDPLGECNSVCMSNPECMGLDSAASSVWRTYTRYETSWQTPTQPRAIIVTDYNDDARCTYYYGEPTGQIKTKNVKSYKNVSYSGVI